MYASLLELSTPSVVLCAMANYMRWTHVGADAKIEEVFNRSIYWNSAVPAAILIAGSYEVYYGDKPDPANANQRIPLTWPDRITALAKLFIHAAAIGLTGAVVSHWCYTRLSS